LTGFPKRNSEKSANPILLSSYQTTSLGGGSLPFKQGGVQNPD